MCVFEFCFKLCSDVKKKKKSGLGPCSKLQIPDQWKNAHVRASSLITTFKGFEMQIHRKCTKKMGLTVNYSQNTQSVFLLDICGAAKINVQRENSSSQE